MNEELNNELLRKVEVILEELDKEISELPRPQVWVCKNIDEIETLINRMDTFIESCYSAMSGTMDSTRDMLKRMVEMGEKEIEEAKNVMFSLGRK